MHIIFVPLDERPVNVDIPQQVAAIAGVSIEIPSVRDLPSMRSAANLKNLHAWMLEQAGDKSATHLIACVDTVVHGGLIPGRISHESFGAVIERLEVFRMMKQTNPGLIISAVSLIMRASDSYSAAEEPDYWSSHGRELHRVGVRLHKELIAEILEREGGSVSAIPEGNELCKEKVPPPIVGDFELRRLRNHLVNLSAMLLHEEGVIETLALTADDTAPYSAGSAEQVWLRHWGRGLPNGPSILMNPGADEVGAVLVARSLTEVAGSPSFIIMCGNIEGLDQVPNFENVPLRESLNLHIEAAGGLLAAIGEIPDIALVVHPPDPSRGDYFGQIPESDLESTQQTIAEIKKALSAGYPVALADLRFSNGGDPTLVDQLAQEGLLLQLSSYAGWNTAGNSIGSAVAHSTASWAGKKLGSFDQIQADRALLIRILDDRFYQSGLRPRLDRELFEGEIGQLSQEIQRVACARIIAEAQIYLDSITGEQGSWLVKNVVMPWSRSFEIAIHLEKKIDGH